MLACRTENEAKRYRQGPVCLVARQAVLVNHHVHHESQSNHPETMCPRQKERCRGEKSCQDRRLSDGACAYSVERSQMLLAMQSIDETCGQAMVQMGRVQLQHFPACHDDCHLMVWAVAERKAGQGTVLTPAVTLATGLRPVHLG